MGTKYILHGGYAGHINRDNDLFFKEILKDAPEHSNILLVLFAKEKDKIEANKNEDIAQFIRNGESKQLSFDVADEINFIEQIKKADVIYLHGGKTSKLINVLKKFPTLKDLFKGKIVAGESAGAYALSAFAYSIVENTILEGLGCVTVKTLCHYSPQQEDKLHELDKLPAHLETLLLADYKYKVFPTKNLRKI